MSKEIFVSHASKDKPIIDAFVDIILHGGLSVPIAKIFCVSTDGTKIKSGDDWRRSIQANLQSAKINFLIITPHYKESEVCLNEMGAAWVSDALVLPLIVEPINYKTVGVIHEPTQIEKLLDESGLDRIKDRVQEKLEIPSSSIPSDRWTAKKREFLVVVKKHLKASPFPVPMDRDTFNTLVSEAEIAETTIENLIEEKHERDVLIEELKKTKDKKEVAEIIKKRNPISQFQEFQELCKTVSKNLNEYPPIVRGVIFKDYSGKNVDINWSMYKEELDKAYANDIITEDIGANWKTTSEMRELWAALHHVSLFLSKESLKSEFHDEFEEKYSAPLKIGNIKFWEEVFKTPITI